MGVVSVMAAASLPAQQFVKNNQRLMMTSERLRFAVYATFLSILVTALLFGAAILVFAGWDNMPALFEQFIATVGGDASLGFLALGIACLISFAVIYFAVGFFGKQSLKALQK